MGQILVIRGGALGDFILTLPVLEALRRHFPEARLEVLGYPRIAALARLGARADAVHPIEARPLAGFFARNGSLDPATSAFFSGFAVILSFLYDPDGIFRENVLKCTRAQFIQGPHRPDDTADLHATEVFLQPLKRLGIFEADPAPALSPEPLPPGPGRWIAVHPGSGSESKNWPERRWSELLGRLVERTDLQILMVGGDAEGARLERLAGSLPSTRLRLARNLPLGELAALLRACGHFVGHDSGITHLAAAVGLPCVVLWGPTNPAVWRPRGEAMLLLQEPAGLAALEADLVWTALHPRLAAAREQTHA